MQNEEKREKKIAVVSLNPCVDKTVWVEKFMYGGTNRVLQMREDVAGKGVNVCMALKSLGQPCICIGMDYPDSRRSVADVLEASGIESAMIVLQGTLRTNLKIFERSTGVMSEINEKGNTVSGAALQDFLQRYESELEKLDRHSMVIFSGSVPPGIPADIYGTLIRMAKAKELRTLFDASGEPLLRGMEELPFAAKPNQDEISLLTGQRAETLEDATKGARELLRRGVKVCCVSMGKEGAVYVTENGIYRAPALPVPVRGIQGAGDSLVAGMSLALLQELPEKEVIRYAMAAAGGSIMREGSQMCTREQFQALLPKVTLHRIPQDNEIPT